jgi:hypothetical protein
VSKLYWPDLVFPPINLWSAPAMNTGKTQVKRVLTESSLPNSSINSGIDNEKTYTAAAYNVQFKRS